MGKKTISASKRAAQNYGRRGGKTTRDKYGREHFRNLARKRWDKVKA